MFEFVGPEIPLDIVCNDEQLLHMALHVQATAEPESELCQIAESVIVWYVMKEFKLAGREFDDGEISQRTGELIYDHAMTGLISKGLVDVDLSGNEPEFITSDLGKKFFAERLENNDG